MPSSKSEIVARVTKSDPKLGERWLTSINPPFSTTSAHRSLLEGRRDYVRAAASAFGHRRKTRGAPLRFEEAALTLDAWEEQYGEDFNDWNYKCPEGTNRLLALDGDRVGAVLCVARRGRDGPPYITVMGGPTVTPVNTADRKYQGAPHWRTDLFNASVVNRYLDTEQEYQHVVAASTASFLPDEVPTTIGALTDAVQPVLITPSTQFMDRVRTMDNEDIGPFKVLFLPMYCDPPVGLYFPTDIGYDEFVELIKGAKPFGALSRMLQNTPYKQVFRAWFEAAAADPDGMVVDTYNAMPLWHELPRYGPIPIDDAHLLMPFQTMFFKLFWQVWCYIVLCGLAKDDQDDTRRRHLATFLTRVSARLPVQQLGWPKLTAQEYPFVPNLFQDSQNTWVRDLLLVFTVADPVTIPPAFKEVGMIDLANTITQSDRGSDSEDDNAAAGHRGLMLAQRSSSTEFPGRGSPRCTRSQSKQSQESRAHANSRETTIPSRSPARHQRSSSPSDHRRRRPRSPDSPAAQWQRTVHKTMVTDDRHGNTLPRQRRQAVSGTPDQYGRYLRQSPSLERDDHRGRITRKPHRRHSPSRSRSPSPSSDGSSFTSHRPRRRHTAKRHLDYDDSRRHSSSKRFKTRHSRRVRQYRSPSTSSTERECEREGNAFHSPQAFQRHHRRTRRRERSYSVEEDRFESPAGNTRSGGRWATPEYHQHRSSRRRERRANLGGRHRQGRNQPLVAGFYSSPDSDSFSDASVSSRRHLRRPQRRPPRKVKMTEATIISRDECANCPAEFIQASLLHIRAIPPDERLKDAHLGHRRAPDDYAFVYEPTDFAKDEVLGIFDPNSGVTANTVESIVSHQCQYGKAFPSGGKFHGGSFRLSADLIKSWYQVTQWQVTPGDRAKDLSEGFHVLDFAQAADPTLERNYIPHEGYDFSQAQRIAKVLYYSMALVGMERSRRTGNLDDRLFRKSVFGDALYLLCNAPFNYHLSTWWTKHQRQASGLWIRDIMMLFQVVAKFIHLRVGNGPRNTFTMMDTRRSRDPVVCASVIIPTTHRGGQHDNFLREIYELKKGFAKWSRTYYYGDEPDLQQPAPSYLFNAKSQPSLPEEQSLPSKDKTKTKSKRNKSAKQFTAKKPLFKFLKSCTDGRNPQEMLKDVADCRSWPTLPAEGDAGTQGKVRQLCFTCAFESSKTCKDMKTCHPAWTHKAKGQRLHVDLDDSRWERYDKTHWKPLIDFQRQWYQWFHPTDDFKSFLPDANWKLE